MPDPQSILTWLIAQYPTAKRTTLRQMVTDGRVQLNGQRAKSLKQPVADADTVTVLAHAAAAVAAAPSLEPLRLVHEDDDVIVVEKPAGLLTSTVPNERRPTAIAILRRHFHGRARVGVIHRLDQDASGLLVFTKNEAAFDNLKRQFIDHTVERIYSAIVMGTPEPPTGRIETLLVEYADGTVHVTPNELKGEHAVTEYSLVRAVTGRSWLRLKLQTGRKHQIRVHLAHIGHPIVGERVYSDCRKPIRLMLAATELSFNHPRTGARLQFKIDAPEEFARIIREKNP